jgi:hypothetical protein
MDIFHAIELADEDTIDDDDAVEITEWVSGNLNNALAKRPEEDRQELVRLLCDIAGEEQDPERRELALQFLEAVGLVPEEYTGRIVGVQDALDPLPQPHRAALSYLPTTFVWGEGGGGAGDDVDQVHRLADRRHLRFGHGALGEEAQVECLLGGNGDPLRTVPGTTGLVRQAGGPVGGVAEDGAAWFRTDMKETVQPSSWPSAVPSPATVSSTRAYP